MSRLKTYKPLKSKTPLKRSEIKRSQKPIKQESSKNRKKNAKYRKAVPLKDVLCWDCGNVYATSRHHIFSQAKEMQIDTEPLNLVPLCGACHGLAEASHEAFRERFEKREPERFARLVELKDSVGKVNAIKRAKAL